MDNTTDGGSGGRPVRFDWIDELLDRSSAIAKYCSATAVRNRLDSPAMHFRASARMPPMGTLLLGAGIQGRRSARGESWKMTLPERPGRRKAARSCRLSRRLSILG